MHISIDKPGLLATVQDMGRTQHLAEGVPVSGVMDQLSASIANVACGNDVGAAVIEFTFADVAFTTVIDIVIAYAGQGLTLKTNDQELPKGKAILIPQGTKINSAPEERGCRTYLAIAGGWDVPEIMGSRSTCLVAGFGGYEGRALKKGAILNAAGNKSELSHAIIASLTGLEIKFANWSIPREMFVPAESNIIRVMPGPEFTQFDAYSILNFLSQPFALSTDSNRMGYRLEGETLTTADQKEMISTAVTPGTIQVANNGHPILLMSDCQTTGGYPRIAQVAAVDLPLCAQLKPGDAIFFSEISRHEAEMLYLEQQEELRQLQVAIRMKYGLEVGL